MRESQASKEVERTAKEFQALVVLSSLLISASLGLWMSGVTPALGSLLAVLATGFHGIWQIKREASPDYRLRLGDKGVAKYFFVVILSIVLFALCYKAGEFLGWNAEKTYGDRLF